MRPVIPVEANGRNFELANQALSSLCTRLEHAENRTTMSEETRAKCKQLREWLSSYAPDITQLEQEAIAFIASQRAKRGAR